MCTRSQCEKHVGKWVKFRTPFGVHQGIIEEIRGDKAIILSPKQYVPKQVESIDVTPEELGKLDVALAYGGYPGAGGAVGGHYGGYGYWGFGWSRWAVSFLIIYLLWGLLFFW